MYWEMLRFRVSYELHGRPPKKRKDKKKPEDVNGAASDSHHSKIDGKP
jgi:hypothetical protein